MRTAIDAAVIKEGKILLVKKNQTWILPGGQPEGKELDLECLCREIKEELSGTEIENMKYYGEFIGKTPHQGDLLKAKVYFADIKGTLNKPSAEISDYTWFNGITIKSNISIITKKVIDSLRRDKYLIF